MRLALETGTAHRSHRGGRCEEQYINLGNLSSLAAACSRAGVLLVTASPAASFG